MRKVIGICGSTRKGSYNKILLKIALNYLESIDYEVEIIDLSLYPLPLYDADLEMKSGLPDNAIKLKEILKSSTEFIIASPEYNSAISGVLKNFIDWCSRKSNSGETPLICFRDKRALIMSTSPGKLGGLRGLYCLRNILENIRVSVIPEFLTFSGADTIFKENIFINSKDKIKLKKVIMKYYN